MRLWPLSRSQAPKPFLDLGEWRGKEGSSLFQNSILRFSKLFPTAPIVVLGAACHAERLRAEAGAVLPAARIELILEAVARGTAPACLAAALFALKRDPHSCLVVQSCDCFIEEETAFEAAVLRACQEAWAEQRLVVLGVPPRSAQTAYGYIQAASSGEGEGVSPILRFEEKPSPCRAQALFSQSQEKGNIYWNTGLFVFPAQLLCAEAEHHCPSLLASLKEAVTNASCLEGGGWSLKEEDLNSCPSLSIDQAVMEKTKRGGLMPLSATWHDLGSWKSLWDSVCAEENSRNVLRGDIVAQDVENVFLHASCGLLAVRGVKDLCVVQTQDATLVAHSDALDDLKALYAALEAQDRAEIRENVTERRPWGFYERIASGPRFKTKRLVVKPGACLSLQMHHHRSEHWVVVRGTARVTSAQETFLLSEGQSAYIPVGTVHRLENPGKIPLEVIEVQTGAYLEEDDILRLPEKE